MDDDDDDDDETFCGRYILVRLCDGMSSTPPRFKHNFIHQ